MNFSRRNLLLIRSLLVLVAFIVIGISKYVFPNKDEPAGKSATTENAPSPRTNEPTRKSATAEKTPSAKAGEPSIPKSREARSSATSELQTGRISVFCFDVVDGDTLRLKDSKGATIKLRMKGIDAPEYRPQQAYGPESRQAMIDKVKGKQIEVLLISKDQYDRDLGIAYYQGLNLNEEQIRLGNAWSYAYKRDPEYARMKQLEQEARSAKRGLWALPDPQNPREFRDSHPKN